LTPFALLLSYFSLEENFAGVIDVIERRALSFDGEKGENSRDTPIVVLLIESTVLSVQCK
jgi:hypothetical protein